MLGHAKEGSAGHPATATCCFCLRVTKFSVSPRRRDACGDRLSSTHTSSETATGGKRVRRAGAAFRLSGRGAAAPQSHFPFVGILSHRIFSASECWMKECVNVEINLAELHVMHPRLPADLVQLMVERAALALERNDHAPGVSASWDWNKVVANGRLVWPEPDSSAIGQHDHNRITEDGAEAVALALVHHYRAWRIVRRLQREEHADWLLEDCANGQRELIALEVSGVDRGTIVNRVTAKLAQVSRSKDVDQKWVGVVGFERPTASLCSTPIQAK
jgi:hypothetical protein